MQRICVFCGASSGGRGAYAAGAVRLAQSLLKRQLGLVYGGASVGLMGEVATAMLTGGGEVIGVIPQALVDKEVALQALPDLRVVGSMHERKALMAELSDGFIALPGGLGTLEELFEILTWAQLGLHRKPCGLLNIGGYYDPLLRFLEHAAAEGFVKPRHLERLLAEEEPEALLARFERFQAPPVEQWIKPEQS